MEQKLLNYLNIFIQLYANDGMDFYFALVGQLPEWLLYVLRKKTFTCVGIEMNWFGLVQLWFVLNVQVIRMNLNKKKIRTQFEHLERMT